MPGASRLNVALLADRLHTDMKKGHPALVLILALSVCGAQDHFNSARAEALIRAGNYRAARAALGTPDPGSPAQLLLARTYFLEEAHAPAEPVIRSYLKRHPDSAEGKALLGAILVGLNRMQDAERTLQEAVRLNPQQASALKQLAFVLHRQGRNEEAVREARHSLDVDRSDAEAHLLLGLACYALHDLPAAIRAAQEAVQLKPDYLDAQILLAQALMDDRQYDNALFLLELAHQTNAPRSVKSEKPLLLHGQLLIALGRPDDADRMFAGALALNRRCVPALLGRARARLIAGDFNGAATHAEAARALEPENDSVDVVVLRAYRGLRDTAKAEDAARRLERVNWLRLRGRSAQP
jgi:tetratricopeptide (TPR) repeat protein